MIGSRREAVLCVSDGDTDEGCDFHWTAFF